MRFNDLGEWCLKQTLPCAPAIVICEISQSLFSHASAASIYPAPPQEEYAAAAGRDCKCP